jgi:hypothetical protein
MKIYNNPYLLDFLSAAARMPEDERDQLKRFTGHDYDVDGIAIGNYTVEGPKWVAKTDEGLVLAVGGFVPQRPGVWRDFMLTTPEAWLPEHALKLTRACRRIMDAMFISGQAHRLECVAPLSRVESRKELESWYKVLKYKREATLQGYCADGYPAVLFSRVGR